MLPWDLPLCVASFYSIAFLGVCAVMGLRHCTIFSPLLILLNVDIGLTSLWITPQLLRGFGLLGQNVHGTYNFTIFTPIFAWLVRLGINFSAFISHIFTVHCRAGPYFFPHHEMVILTILMSTSGFSLKVFVFSILCTTSRPCTARPKTVCLLSNQGVFSVVMKN